MTKILQFIEKTGNKLPHPTALFIIFCGVIIVTSAIAAALGLQAQPPNAQAVVEAKSLLTRDGIQFMLSTAVKNFVNFAPVGTVLVAILGLGIAEHSGLLGYLLKSIVRRTPNSLITSSIVFCGVISSLAADAGYVVLIPLAGIVFLHAGKSPIAGIAAAFAGVSAGYSANLIIGPLDAILAGLSQEAAQVIDVNYNVNLAGNYYFIVASTFLITLIASLVCKFITEKQTAKLTFERPLVTTDHNHAITHSRGLVAAGITFAAIMLCLTLCTLPQTGWLRADDGSLLNSPFTRSIVVIIAMTAALCGIAFGVGSGRYKSWKDSIAGMEKSIATLAGYLVLMFFAAQFVSYFKWSQLGTILAVSGASGLSSLNLPLPILLVVFVFLAGIINLFIGSAAAKWALLAPIFIPMFMLLGITPEATQMAYRIGDSCTNIITPLMPYFGVVIAFFHHYNKKLGSGTIISLMLPYSAALIVAWVTLLSLWLILNLPLGPNTYAFLT